MDHASTLHPAPLSPAEVKMLKDFEQEFADKQGKKVVVIAYS